MSCLWPTCSSQTFRRRTKLQGMVRTGCLDQVIRLFSSAFFRRTVLHSKSYKCSRSEKCFSIKGKRVWYVGVLLILFPYSGHNKHGCRVFNNCVAFKFVCFRHAALSAVFSLACKLRVFLLGTYLVVLCLAVSASKASSKSDALLHKIGSLKQITRSWNACYVIWHRVMLESNDNNMVGMQLNR